MARRLVSSSSQYLSVGTAAATAAPLTIAAWVKPSNTTDSVYVGGLCPGPSGAEINWFLLSLFGAESGDPVVAYIGAWGTGEAQANTTVPYQAGVWGHACAVFASSTSRSAYYNGGGKGTNTTSRTPTGGDGLDTSIIGAFWYSAGTSGHYDGEIADFAIWNVALSDAEVYLLANGRKADGSRIRPWDIKRNNLVCCPRLELGGIVAAPDRITSFGPWTVSGGASPMPTPRFLLPPRRRRYAAAEAAGGGGGGGQPPRSLHQFRLRSA